MAAIPDDYWREGRAGSRVLRRLHAALASAGGTGLERHELADRLWPESDGDRAIQNLDSALNDLRRVLRRARAGAIVTRGTRYHFESDAATPPSSAASPPVRRASV